ncbi:N-acetylmuramoyl-L-alanine amidase [Bacillus subtilis]|nr:N-acetylmuramoyl-L-alanine amidase [Bacillus subtilis]
MAIKVVKNLVSKSKYGLKCPNPMKADISLFTTLQMMLQQPMKFHI